MVAIRMENKQKLTYSLDEFGKEILLKDGSLQVMMEWEKPYMEACIDALEPYGDVLEIGFGLGYSATRIQKHHPRSHTIIECDTLVIEKAKKWAQNYTNVKIVCGYWQEQLESLSLFDIIFFDDYTPFTAEEVKKIEEGIGQLQKINIEIGSLHRQLEKKLEECLKKKPNIINFSTREETHLEEKNDRENQLTKIDTLSIEKESDRLINFFTACLDHHMRDGARMSSYIDYDQFKTQKHRFDSLISSRSDVSYTTEIIPIDVPKNCFYYPDKEALILVITKLKA